MRLLLILMGCVMWSGGCRKSPFIHHMISPVLKKGGATERIDKSPVNVDEDLYSRQLLVYGMDSQVHLMKSHVAIVGSG